MDLARQRAICLALGSEPRAVASCRAERRLQLQVEQRFPPGSPGAGGRAAAGGEAASPARGKPEPGPRGRGEKGREPRAARPRLHLGGNQEGAEERGGRGSGAARLRPKAQAQQNKHKTTEQQNLIQQDNP